MNLHFPTPVAPRLPILLCLAAICLFPGEVGARSPISFDVLQRDGYGSVKLIEGLRNALFVPTEINGSKLWLLMDTGWGGDGITVGRVDPSSLQIVPEKGMRVGMSASGAPTPVRRGIAHSVVMGNVHIENARIYFGRLIGSGFLSHGFMKKCSAIIDLTNLRIYLRPPGVGRPVNLGPALASMGLSEVPILNGTDGSFVLNVEVNGVPAQMALDTGAQVSVVDTRFARVARTRGWGRRHTYELDAAGVATAADFAGTKSFKINGIPIRTPTVLVTRFAGYDLTHGKMVGVIGLDMLGLNWGIIDLARQKFYFIKAN